MGYTTDFIGEFKLNRKLDSITHNFLNNVVDYNCPPEIQPSSWCQWIPTEDGMAIVWDGGEKFYEYVDWIKYLITKVLAPAGYILNGEVEWQGEDREDMGKIVITNNVVKIQTATITFEDEKE
jgi:hypothetical protein